MDGAAGSEVAGPLLDCVRSRIGDAAIDYAERPAAIRGGYDTRIFAFRLRKAADAWREPLILRLLGPQHEPARALREAAVQNAVAGLGYPAPRVLMASADPAPLGGAFLIMARLPGRTLLAERWTSVGSVLVKTQRALHALDAEPLLAAMDGVGGRGAVTFDGLLTQLGARIARGSLDGLRAAMDWLMIRRPPAAARPVICHGDLHPQNILVRGGAVTGVLDWPNAVVADPAYDVAATRIILGLVPVELSAAPVALRGLVRLVRPLLLARYLAGFREPPFDPEVFAYYEAASAMRHLVRAAEARRAASAGAGALSPLDASPFAARLASRLAHITGTGVRP